MLGALDTVLVELEVVVASACVVAAYTSAGVDPSASVAVSATATTLAGSVVRLRARSIDVCACAGIYGEVFHRYPSFSLYLNR